MHGKMRTMKGLSLWQNIYELYSKRLLNSRLNLLNSKIASMRCLCVAQTSVQENKVKKPKRRPHVPVMAKEVLEMFQPLDNQVFIDMTFGAGGHSEKILKAAKNVTIYAVDRDEVACNFAKKLEEKYKGQVVPLCGKFSELEDMLTKCKINKGSVDGILFDVGASSMQMDDPERGFALSSNSPLDMRMSSKNNEPSANDVINTLDSDSLTKIFKTYGEEKAARSIAEAILETRFLLMRINSTHELATLVENVLSRRDYPDKIGRASHVATKTFQALRIFVNDELNELDCGMELAWEYLRPGGKLVTLCFHSLEDRIVKRHISGIDVDDTIGASINLQHASAGKWYSQVEIDNIFSNRWLPINKKVITPTDDEVHENPRSRSARLRAAIKA